MCVRADAGNCCIAYSTCTDANSWTLDTTTNTMTDTQCTEDYLGINGNNLGLDGPEKHT